MITWKETTNKFCKMLDVWWAVEKGSFRRTPLSGAFDKKKFPGDVIGPLDFPFCIECKGEEDGWDFRLTLHDKNAIHKHIEQCLKDAMRSKKVPMLAFTKKYLPVYGGLPLPFYLILKRMAHLEHEPNVVTSNADGVWVWFVLWNKGLKPDSSFLKTVGKDVILKASAEYIQIFFGREG